MKQPFDAIATLAGATPIAVSPMGADAVVRVSMVKTGG